MWMPTVSNTLWGNDFITAFSVCCATSSLGLSFHIYKMGLWEAQGAKGRTWGRRKGRFPRSRARLWLSWRQTTLDLRIWVILCALLNRKGPLCWAKAGKNRWLQEPPKTHQCDRGIPGLNFLPAQGRKWRDGPSAPLAMPGNVRLWFLPFLTLFTLTPRWTGVVAVGTEKGIANI